MPARQSLNIEGSFPAGFIGGYWIFGSITKVSIELFPFWGHPQANQKEG